MWKLPLELRATVAPALPSPLTRICLLAFIVSVQHALPNFHSVSLTDALDNFWSCHISPRRGNGSFELGVHVLKLLQSAMKCQHSRTEGRFILQGILKCAVSRLDYSQGVREATKDFGKIWALTGFARGGFGAGSGGFAPHAARRPTEPTSRELLLKLT